MTVPVKVLVPVAPVAELRVPVIELVPAKVTATAPKLSVPLGTESMPNVYAPLITLVPVETRVLVASIVNVPPELMVPVRL